MSKSVNVDFVTRQIEVETDGKEHFISAAMAAKDAEAAAVNAQNAANTAEKIATDLGLVDEAVQTAVSSAGQASNSATTASDKADIATAKADIATAKASEASTSAETASQKANAASTSATNAAQSYANADAVATQLTEYLAGKETLTAPAVDKTLLIDGAAADSKVVGELKSDLSELKTYLNENDLADAGVGIGICLYFGKNVYLQSVNPKWMSDTGNYTYEIFKSDSGAIVDDASCTLVESGSGVIGQPVIINRVFGSDELIRFATSDANIMTCSSPTNNYDAYTCYKTYNGTISQVESRKALVRFGGTIAIREYKCDNALSRIDKLEKATPAASLIFSPASSLFANKSQVVSNINAGWCLYFAKPTYVKSIKISFDVQGVSANYKIGKVNDGSTLSNGDSVTLGDSVTFTTGDTIKFNRIFMPNEFLRFGSSNAYPYVCDKSVADYPIKFAYTNGSTITINDYYNNLCVSGAIYVFERIDENHNFGYWHGKKIVWFGTSIPEGKYNRGDKYVSYPMIVGEKIGAEVINEAVGGSCVACRNVNRVSDDNPYGFIEDFASCARCLGGTLEEKEWLISHYADSIFTQNRYSTMTSEQADQIRNWSYERKLLKYFNDSNRPNLYVFDIGRNDQTDVSPYKYSELVGTYGEDNGFCYIGGMNKLLRLIYQDNPSAQVVMVSHYTTGQWFYQTIEMQEAVANSWGIECFRLDKRIQWSDKEIETTGYWQYESDSTTNAHWVNSGGQTQTITIRKANIPDGTHPHYDSTGKATNRIAEILSAWLLNLKN